MQRMCWRLWLTGWPLPSLSHRTTAPPLHHLTIPSRHSTTSLPHRPTTPSPHHPTTPPPHHSTTPLPHYPAASPYHTPRRDHDSHTAGRALHEFRDRDGTASAATQVLGQGWQANIKSGDKATARTLLSVLVSIPGMSDSDVAQACSYLPEIKADDPGKLLPLN